MVDRVSFQRELLKQMRINGKNQTDIAKAMDVSKGTVSAWVCGRGYPRIDMIQRLADYFHITTDEMASGTGDSIDYVRETNFEYEVNTKRMREINQIINDLETMNIDGLEFIHTITTAIKDKYQRKGNENNE